MFLRDNKAFEEETHKILARTVSCCSSCCGRRKAVSRMLCVCIIGSRQMLWVASQLAAVLQHSMSQDSSK
jgi:hypothetical protein